MSKRIGRLPILTAIVAGVAVTAAAPSAFADVFINEIHYDNTGGDVGEAVEVVATAGEDLSLYSVELYNGSGGVTYGSSPYALPAGSTDCSGATIATLNFPANGLQNGAPDGLALIGPGPTVVQFLSYEGSLTATNGTAIGLTSTDILVSEDGSGPIGESLQLNGSGTSYADFAWSPSATATFGACNTSQSFAAALPNLSIDDVSMAEGDGGTTTFTFTVSIDATSASDVTFDYATADGTAMLADNDYVEITTTAGTITAGTQTTTIDVTVNGDMTLEPDETFTVELSNVVGANVTDGVGTGTILDDDAAELVINEVDYDQAGADIAEFVELKNVSDSIIDLSLYELVFVNGAAGAPYNTFALSGSLGAGHYFVLCGNAANTPNCDLDVSPNTDLIQNGSSDGIILRLAGGGAVEDSLAYEGNSAGATEGTGASAADSNAIDFIGLSRFPDGTDTNDNDTDFSLRCISPGKANIAADTSCPAPTAIVPELSISDASVTEGGNLVFGVTLDIDASAQFDVTYTIVDGSATVADNDYDNAGSGGTITFTGGTAGTVDIIVPTIGDATPELDENLTVVISNVTAGDAVIVDDTGVGTILNDDGALPTVSISDATPVAEGNGTGNDLVFNVTLDINAATEFSVTYNIVDGTATVADSDYDNTGSGGTITFTGGVAGTQQIIVPTIGDTTYENDEQFTVVISNVSAGNAVISDDTGVGTIQNDDRAPVWVIQGAGAFSPFVPGASLGSNTNGATVDIKASVVTAVAYRADNNNQQAFFMQTPDAESDGNAATSDGIYVYSSTPVAIGDLVEVSGTVQEYYGTTEIGSATVNVISSGNALPTPVIFSAGSGMPSLDPTTLTCPGSGPGGTNNDDTNFECFEGMLVSIPEAIALQGNRRRTNDNYSELQFTPRAQRSLREQGVRYPDATTLANAAAGMWDGNPEVMEMDPDIARRGATGPTPGIDTEIAGGATFSASGVLTFDFGDYVFWPTTLNVDAASNVLPRPVDAAVSSELSVGSFNMLRFCDIITGEHVYTCDSPEPDQPALDAKLVKLSAYVREVLRSPDVVGVQEVETQAILADLATQISNDGGPTYTAYLVEGNDGGGIDVGYLVKDSRVKNATVTQYLAAETWDDPACSPCAPEPALHDRPPLLLEADFQPTPSDPLMPFAIINNHTRSRGGVDTGDERVRAKRFLQAKSIARLVQDFQTATNTFAGQATNTTPLILVGDYNAYQFTDGYVDVVGMIAGTYDDNANTCAPSNAVTDCKLGGQNIVSPALQNLVLSVDANEQYSFLFTENFGLVMGYSTPNPARDVATGQILDNVLANHLAVPYVTNIQYGRANTDASINGADLGSGPDGAGGTQLSQAIGSSDHDGVVAYFETDCSGALKGDANADTDNDGICQLIDNCPADANDGQEDANGNGYGDACDAAPVADDDAYAATEDTTLNVSAPGVLVGDTDTEQDSLTATLVSGPATGNLTLNTDGSFDYTPAANVCDNITPVTFTYQASDGGSTSNTATVSITVACVNDAPVANNDSYNATEDTTLNVSAPGVLGNDTDADGDGLTASLVSGPATGSLTLNSDGSFDYTPAANVCNATPVTFTYMANDGTADSNVATASILVACVDDPAVLADDTASVDEDAAATAIDVLANDVDPDSVLLISGFTQPANGTVVVTGGGTGLTYQPDANYCNTGGTTDDFTYDANGQTATVRVTVNCLDDDAVAVDDAATVTQNSSANLIDVLNNDTPDPDFALSIDSVDASSAQGGSVSISGSQVSYTPANGFCGTTDTFSYTLVGGSSATVTVTVDCLPAAIFADGFED